MLRFLFLALVALVVATLLTRSPRLRRVLWIVFCLIALYGLLKITGVIEALAPDRM